jgi:hypothetical protein
MPSPTCTVNTASTANGVDLAALTTITIQLADLTGVSTWTIECIGTDELQTAAAVNAALSINTATKTATKTGGYAEGTALLFRSVVNGGRDVNGTVVAAYTTTFAVYVLTANGDRVLAVGETTEGDASFGWISKINGIIRAGAAGVVAGQGIDVTGSTVSVDGDFGALDIETTGAVNADTVAASYVSAESNVAGTSPESTMFDNDGSIGAVTTIHEVSTTDATVTTLATSTPYFISDGIVTVTSIFDATLTNASNGFSIGKRAVFLVVGGVVTQLGATETTMNAPAGALACDATIDTSANAIRLRVTGIIATNIRWGALRTEFSRSTAASNA